MKISTTFASLALLLSSSSLSAAVSVVSDEFTGDEPEMNNQSDMTFPGLQLFKTYTPVKVSITGTYGFRVARNNWGFRDYSIAIHTGNFNPANPNLTLVEVVDFYAELQLQSDTDYTFVVQPYDDIQELPQAFGIAVSGPGQLSGDQITPSQDQLSGEFDGNENLINTAPDFANCPNSFHDVIGPFNFDETAYWYISDLAFDPDPPDTPWGIPLSISLHKGSFDANNPLANQTWIAQGVGQFLMHANTDYYLVVQPLCTIQTGDWAMVMTKQADSFVWNPHISATWQDPATDGSGILLDVLYETKAVFMAWFTWATEHPDPSLPSDVGDPGTRWMVAFGSYENQSQRVVDFDVYFPTGGRFNQAPALSQPNAGKMTLDMHNGCSGGTLSYKLDSGLEGTAKMNLLVHDSLAECLGWGARPGVHQAIE